MFFQILLTFKNLLLYIFFISSKIGQFIVISIKTSFENVYLCITAIWTLIRILYEDFTIFLQDVTHRITYLLDIINYGLEIASQMVNKILAIFTLATTVILGVNAAIQNVIFGLIALLANVATLIKKCTILFGAGIWFAITIIPLAIFYAFTLLIYSIGCLAVELSNVIQNIEKILLEILTDIFRFFFDVPLEATAGLIIGLCFIYLCTKFSVNLYTYVREELIYVSRSFRRLNRNIYNKIGGLWRQNNIVQTGSQLDVNRKTDSRNCVICLERVKSILFLPCRHVCLCTECNSTMRRYLNHCPLCRNNIENSIKVYV